MADKNSVRLAAADLLLDRGVRFTVTDAPVLLKWLGLNKIRIRPLRGGTIAAISRVVLENHLEDIKELAEANRQMEALARCVAIAILNRKRLIERFAGRLARFLMWHTSPVTLFQVYLIVAGINSISDFMNITGYFVIQTHLMMNPKNPGQQTAAGS